MGLLLGLLAGAAGFLTTVYLLNVLSARIGAAQFNPSYKPGVEAKYPNLVLGLTLITLGGLGYLAFLGGILSWYLAGVALMPILMVFAWAYFTFIER